MAVAAHLAASGAPVIPPTRAVDPGPHVWRQLTVTLWEYVEPVGDGSLAPSATAAAIKVVHRLLAGFTGRLPAFTVELDDASRLLEPDRSPSLDEVDRRFLSGVVGEVRAALATLQVTWRALHGSPHDGNWLVSVRGPLLLDFETACRGPIEWISPLWATMCWPGFPMPTGS